MGFKFNIIIVVSVIVLIVTLSFPRYINYCKKCAQTCGIFTNKSLGNCISECWCPNIEPHINKHINDYSTFDTEKNICPNGYADTPHVYKKQNPSIKPSIKPPNIVLFILDDLDELISPYLDAMPFTKELFKLNGTHFTNGYTSTSYCCPARCQVFSGLYPHNNGVLGMHGKYGSIEAFRKPHYLNGTRMMENGKCINNENRAINLLLQKYGGYHTSIFGKYLNGIEHEASRHIDYVPPGWDECHMGSDPYMYSGYRYTLTNWSSDTNVVNYKWYGVKEHDYITDVIRDRVINVIAKHKNSKQKDKPMFMYVATTAPHLPMPCAERHRHKLEFWRAKYDEYVASRPNYNTKGDKEPKWFSEHKRRMGVIDDGLEWNKLEWEKRMCSLYAVDELIETTYNELKANGQHLNTVFGFTSDNGYNLGAHGIYNKLAPYEESIRVPIYLSGPGIKKSFTDDRIVALIDLPSTFLDIAGLQIPSYMNGLSLVDSNVNLNNRQTLLFQFKNNVDYVPHDHIDFSPELAFIRHVIPEWMLLDFHPYVGIRTKEYMYVEHNVDGKHNDYELYDMKHDPYQLKNIYSNHSYFNELQFMKQRLEMIKNCSGIYCNM